MKAMDEKGLTGTSKVFRFFEERGRKEGLKEGRHEGLAVTVRQFERKLGRALTDPERETLYARAGSLGPARIGDLVLDLDGPALAAWLAAPDAS